MAWSTPRTWSAAEVVTASLMNTHVRDNLNYLFAGVYSTYMSDEGDYTTTSTTFTPVDSTGFAPSVTFTGTRGRASFVGVIAYSAASQGIVFDVEVDGVSISGGDGIAGARCISSGATDVHDNIAFDVPFTVTAGARTVRLVWRVSGGTGTLKSNAGGIMGIRPVFTVEEAGNA